MQRSVERVTLLNVPLDLVCGVVDYFEHVEELKCENIRAPQQVCVYFLCVHYICRLGSLAANSKRNTDNKHQKTLMCYTVRLG